MPNAAPSGLWIILDPRPTAKHRTVRGSAPQSAERWNSGAAQRTIARMEVSLGRGALTARKRTGASVVTVLLAVTTFCALSAPGSYATAQLTAAALLRGTVSLAVSPTVQTLDVEVVSRSLAKTHTSRLTLVLGTAMFKITVKNTNPFGLAGVAIADGRSPRCDRTIGTVAAGASITYSCSAGKVSRNYTNVVTVSGQRTTQTRGLTSTQAPARSTYSATASETVKVKPKVVQQTPHIAFTG